MTTSARESKFKLSDGLEVYTKTWMTPGPPVAHAFFVHGFSDHSNAYYEFPDAIAAAGIEYFSFDQRGWGLSVSQKSQWGVTGPTSKVLSDIDEVLASRLEVHPNIPCFLLGHSMGGGIALTYAMSGKYRSRLAGTVVWSPMLKFAPELTPFSVEVVAGKLLASVVPNFQLKKPLPASYLSRDKSVCDDAVNDKLCHDTGSLICLSDMINRGTTLMKVESGRKFEDKPILVLHGSGDKITDYDSSRQFVDTLKVKDKTFAPYDGWYHKLHADLDADSRIKFSNDVKKWLLERIPSSVNESSSANL